MGMYSGTIKGITIDGICFEQLYIFVTNNKIIDKNNIDIIGHRVVHGGDKYSSAVIIDEQVKKDIEKYIPLAPLHNKVSLLQIKAMEKLLPDAQQIAVFDTAFHHTLPDIISFYPVPYEWHEKYGIRRFGFHGINHQYCAQQAAQELKQDLSTLSLSGFLTVVKSFVNKTNLSCRLPIPDCRKKARNS